MRVLICLFTVTFTLLPFVWCQPPTSTSAPTVAPAPTPLPVLNYTIPPLLSLGLLCPFTGASGIFGPRLEAVARLAIADVLAARNTTGILPYTNLSLVKRDSGNNPLIGTAAALDMFLSYDASGPVSKTKANPTNNDANPIVGVIGDFSSVVSVAISPLLTALQIPMISMAAAAAALSSRTDYPMFARNYINEALQSNAIISIMQKFNWKRAAIIYLKTSGSELHQRLLSVAPTSISFLSLEMNENPTNDEIRNTFQNGIDQRYRVFIIMSTPTYVGAIVNMTIALGMNNGQYAFIGAKDLGQNIAIQQLIAAKQLVGASLSGWIGIPSYEPNNFADSKWNKTYTRLKTMFPQPFLFGMIPPIGFDAFTYEIVWIYALALHNLTTRGVQYWGKPLYDQIMMTEYEGITSQKVKFLAGERDPQVYDIVNWNAQANVFLPFGQWSSSSGLFTIPGSKVIFPGGSTDIPFDQPPRELHELSTTLTNATMAVSIVLLILATITHVWLFVSRSHLVIKTSAWIFCHVMVLGLQLCFISVILKGLSISSYGSIPACSLFPLFLLTGLSLVTAPLVVKTWRLNHIFNDSSLSKTVRSNTQLFAAMLLFCIYDWVVIAIWNGVDQPVGQRVEDPLDRFNDVAICTMKQATAWWILLVVPKGLVLIACCYLAYKVRNLPANFNESKYIGICLYVLFFVAAIILPIIGVIDAQIVLLHVIISIAILAAGAVIGLSFFVPKAWNMFITLEWKNPNATYTHNNKTSSNQNSQAPERKSSIGGHSTAAVSKVNIDLPQMANQQHNTMSSNNTHNTTRPSINPLLANTRGSTASVSQLSGHAPKSPSNANVSPVPTPAAIPSMSGGATNFV